MRLALSNYEDLIINMSHNYDRPLKYAKKSVKYQQNFKNSLFLNKFQNKNSHACKDIIFIIYNATL